MHPSPPLSPTEHLPTGHRSRTANDTHGPPLLILTPRHGCLISNRLRGDPIHNQVLTPMQPLALLITSLALPRRILQQIRSTKHGATGEMPRIDRDDERVLAILLRKVLGDVLGVCEVVVDADEGRGDVGLLVEVCEAEAGECRCVVQDGGLILGREAGGEGVAGLGRGAVHAVDERGDRGWCCSWGGWGEGVRSMT
jgi:hypothetical protein